MQRSVMAVLAVLFAALNVAPALSQSSYDKAREYLAVRDFLSAAPYLVAAAKESPKNKEILTLTGDAFVELEKADSALIYYKRALDVDDEDLFVMRKTARTHALLSQFEAAHELMEDAFDLNEDDVYNYLTRGEIYIMQDSLTRADHAIRKAQSIDDEIPDTYVALGDLYYAQKVYQLAKTNYEEAIARDTTLLEPRIKLARAYWALAGKAGDRQVSNDLLKKSLIQWDMVTKQDTNNAPAFWEKGRILYLAQQYSPAARALLRYTVLRPDRPLAYWWLGRSFYEVQAIDSAIIYLELARQKVDTIADQASLMLARTYYLGKRFEDAAAQFGALQGKVEFEVKDYERYGRSAILSGDTVTAITNLREALDKEPDCKLQLMFGNVLRSGNQYDEAIDAFHKVFEVCDTLVDADRARVYFYIGISNFSRGSLDSAATALAEAVRLDSSNSFAIQRLAFTYREMDSTDKAMEAFRATIDVLKREIEAADSEAEKSRLFKQVDGSYVGLAGIIFGTKDFNELIRVCREWTAFNDKSEYGYLYHAIAEQSLQNVESACTYYRKVLGINPSNKTARQNVDALGCGN